MLMLSWIVHRICRYVLYVATTFRLSIHHSSYLNGAERRTRILRTRYGTKKPEVGLRYSDVMHAFPFSAISESNSCWQRCLIPKITLIIGARRGFEKAGGTMWVVPPHRLLARIPHAFIFQWPPTCVHWYSSSFSESTFGIPGLCAGHPWDLNK